MRFEGGTKDERYIKFYDFQGKKVMKLYDMNKSFFVVQQFVSFASSLIKSILLLDGVELQADLIVRERERKRVSLIKREIPQPTAVPSSLCRWKAN